MTTNVTPDPTPTPTPQPKKHKTKPSAFADILREWESLLTAVADRAAMLPLLEPLRTALAATLDQARQAKGIQESHDASRQTMTQALQEIVVQGKDQAIQLRGAIRSALGPTTEQLKQFGIQPLRRRPLRHKKNDTPAPAPPPPPVEIVAAKAAKETE
jgi:hypothetical protein